MPFPNLDGVAPIEFSEDDWKKIEECCFIHCTSEEISGIMNVSSDTLTRRIREKFDLSFAEYFSWKSAGGKQSLRRSQYSMAMTNPTMAIWIGKQWLKQTDQMEHSGSVNFKLAYSLEEKQDAIEDSTGVIDSYIDEV